MHNISLEEEDRIEKLVCEVEALVSNGTKLDNKICNNILYKMEQVSNKFEKDNNEIELYQAISDMCHEIIGATSNEAAAY